MHIEPKTWEQGSMEAVSVRPSGRGRPIGSLQIVHRCEGPSASSGENWRMLVSGATGDTGESNAGSPILYVFPRE